MPHKVAGSWTIPGSNLLGVDGIGQHLSHSSIAFICSAVCCYIGGRREQLSRSCALRLRLSLSQALLEPAESLEMESHPRLTLSQQSTETQFGWFCTIETTSARRPGNTKTERVAVPHPAHRGRCRAVGVGEGVDTASQRAKAKIELFLLDAKDPVWLRAVGVNCWLGITRDAKIRTHPAERQAIVEYRAGCFIFT